MTFDGRAPRTVGLMRRAKRSTHDSLLIKPPFTKLIAPTDPETICPWLSEGLQIGTH